MLSLGQKKANKGKSGVGAMTLTVVSPSALIAAKLTLTLGNNVEFSDGFALLLLSIMPLRWSGVAASLPT